MNPGSIYKPLDQMEIARTRQALGKPDFAVMPEETQRVDVADLIRCYTINECAAHDGLANRRVAAPHGAVLKEKMNGHRQVMIRRQEAREPQNRSF